MATVTGTPGTSISAQVTVADNGTVAQESDQATTALSIVNDLASISAGNITITGNKQFTGTTTFNPSTGNVTSLQARVVPRSPRVALSDADHSIAVVSGSGVTGGKRFTLQTGSPGSPRTITLKHTTTYAPQEGETIEVICHALGTTGTQYTFKREDATTIATFVGTATTSNVECCAEFEFTGSAWHLGFNSGSAWDGAASFGVIAGGSA